MQVINCGRGVHAREVKGVERLKTLPKDWYAFTNLELAMGIGRARELDLIMVTDHLIFLIDLKDWSGTTIESDSGNWLHNGRDTGAVARRQDSQQRQRCTASAHDAIEVATGKQDLPDPENRRGGRHHRQREPVGDSSDGKKQRF